MNSREKIAFIHGDFTEDIQNTKEKRRSLCLWTWTGSPWLELKHLLSWRMFTFKTLTAKSPSLNFLRWFHGASTCQNLTYVKTTCGTGRDSDILQIKLTVDERVTTYFSAINLRPVKVTPAMRQGRPPASLLPSTTADSKTGLIMIHGYCSATNPWEQSKDQFTNGHYFLNPSASITNEQFAALVIEFAKSKGLTAYAMVSLENLSSTTMKFLWKFMIDWLVVDRTFPGRNGGCSHIELLFHRTG